MGFLRRHWSFILGAISNLPSLWHTLVWLFDWGARVDFVTTKLREHGGATVILGFLLDPPPWLFLVTLPTGAALILWDLKGRPGFWQTSKAQPQINRIPFAEFLKLAANCGWDFVSPSSLHLIDLAQALRQGGLDETLVVWGRLHRYPRSEALMRQEPLDKIPPTHWREFMPHLFPAMDGNNFNTKTWRPTSTETAAGYIDLHVDRLQALQWLKSEATRFKGKTKS